MAEESDGGVYRLHHHERLARLSVHDGGRPRRASEHTAGTLRGGRARRGFLAAQGEEHHPSPHPPGDDPRHHARRRLDLQQPQYRLARDEHRRAVGPDAYPRLLRLQGRLQSLPLRLRGGAVDGYLRHPPDVQPDLHAEDQGCGGGGMKTASNARAKKRLARLATHLVLSLAALAAVYPVLQVVTISLRPTNKLLSTSLELIPDGATLQSYVALFAQYPFLRWAGNSALVSLAVTITGVALASMAGYAFSRFSFTGKKFGLLSLLVTQMFPATMLLLPLYIMLIYLGLINTYLGVIITYTATALPFCIWTMKGYYDTIPVSLEEAARIDGCTQFQSFYKIILPLASPALVITGLFSFMTAWSEYLVAAQILQDTALWTLPLGLKSFEANMSTEWGLYGASSIIVTIPVVILFLALSKYLVSGLTLG